MQGAQLYVMAVGVCVGIVAGIVLQVGFVGAAILLVAAVAIILFALVSFLKYFLFVAIFCASCALGVVCAEVALVRYADTGLLAYAGEKVEIEGRVVDDPEERATTLRLVVAISEISGTAVSGRVLATIPRGVEVRFGDQVVLGGMLQEPKSFASEGGREFDYPHYLAAEGIVVLMPFATLERVSVGGWSVLGMLYSLKHSFKYSLERLLPEPHGGLMEGLLLGEKRGIPEELHQAFIQSSLVHMIVLSGYNIAIVANAVLRTVSVFLPQAFALGLGGVTIIFFALMVGGGEATVRALLMALIAILAQYLGRPKLALRSLAVAAALMALWNPLAAVYSPSLILSVLATFGLITLSPWAEHKITGWKFLDTLPRLKLKEIAASTIAVQIFVLPALLYYTGVFSVVALPANLLALPAVPFAMFFGFLAGLAGYILPILGTIFAIPAYILLQWIIMVATIASSLPMSSFVIPVFSVWLTMLAYVPLTWFAIVQYRKLIRGSQRVALLNRSSITPQL